MITNRQIINMSLHFIQRAKKNQGIKLKVMFKSQLGTV